MTDNFSVMSYTLLSLLWPHWQYAKLLLSKRSEPGSKIMKFGIPISLSLSSGEQNLFDDVHIVVDTSVRQSNHIIFINIVTK